MLFSLTLRRPLEAVVSKVEASAQAPPRARCVLNLARGHSQGE